MTDVTIRATYYCDSETRVTLEADSWEDIKHWFIKWNTFYYTTDWVTMKEVSLDDAYEIDWKRPFETTIEDPITQEPYDKAEN